MEIHVILGIVLALAGFFVTVFSLWYKIDRDTNSKIDSLGKVFADNLAEAVKQGDDKRARIYERLDTVKTAHRQEIEALHKEVVDTFVSIKWCAMMHTNADKVYAEIKKAIENLESKLDTLLGRG